MNYKNSVFGGVIAFIIATSCCWLPALLIGVGGGSTLIGLSNGMEKFSGFFMVLGLTLIGYGAYQYYHQKKKKETPEIILNSTFTCPQCGFKKDEIMPSNACQYFYECENCNTILKPKETDCCVYCSFGSVPCPPIQSNNPCC